MTPKTFPKSDQNCYKKARRKTVKSSTRSNKHEKSRPRAVQQEDQIRHLKERKQRKTRPAKGEQTKKEKDIIATKHNKTLKKLHGRGEAEAIHSDTFSRLSKNAGVKQSRGRS